MFTGRKVGADVCRAQLFLGWRAIDADTFSNVSVLVCTADVVMQGLVQEAIYPGNLVCRQSMHNGLWDDEAQWL